jgi:hypothetical protein
VIVEAKSHLKEISMHDVDKVIDDCKLRKAFGVFVISETAILS